MSEDPKDRREMSLMAKLSVPEVAEPPWSMLGAGITIFATLICLTVIGPALISTQTTRAVLTPFMLMLSWAIGLALTIIFVLVNRRSSEESWTALQLRRGELPLPLALLVGIAIALGVDLAVSLAGGEFLPVPLIWGFQSEGALGLVSAALVLIVLQPLAETLVFQAVLLPRLRWSFGPWAGLIGTSAAFTALYHVVFIAPFGLYRDLWNGVVFPLGIAFLFCLLKVYSASTSAVIIARMGAGLVFWLTALALVGR